MKQSDWVILRDNTAMLESFTPNSLPLQYAESAGEQTLALSKPHGMCVAFSCGLYYLLAYGKSSISPSSGPVGTFIWVDVVIIDRMVPFLAGIQRRDPVPLGLTMTFFFLVLGVKPGASCMLRMNSSSGATHPALSLTTFTKNEIP